MKLTPYEISWQVKLTLNVLWLMKLTPYEISWQVKLTLNVLWLMKLTPYEISWQVKLTLNILWLVKQPPSCSCSQFAKSLVSQAHLCPLPLHVCPVYWAYDCGLRLYPLPDLVVCADKFDPFTRRSADCSIMNPVST